MLYKIRNNLVATEEDKYLQRGTGRSHQYRQIRADRGYTSFSFFPRTIIKWNQLPSQTCSATSLETFKTNVAKVEHFRLIYFPKKLLSLCLSLFFSFYLSLFLLICLIFFIFHSPPPPFSHSTGDYPQS